MKKEKLIKVEYLERAGKWGIVGQITGKVYYSSSRFDCCWWLGQKENREYYERVEREESTQREK